MFKVLLTVFFLGLALIPTYARETERAGPACELCELVLGTAKSLLQKNQSEAQVLAFIEKELCDRLGPLESLCVNFVESTGKQVIDDLIAGLDPATICKKFGLCSAKTMRRAMKMEERKNLRSQKMISEKRHKHENMKRERPVSERRKQFESLRGAKTFADRQQKHENILEEKIKFRESLRNEKSIHERRHKYEKSITERRERHKKSMAERRARKQQKINH